MYYSISIWRLDLYFSECSVYILASFVLFQTAVMVWYMLIPFTEQVIMDTEHQQNGTKRKPNTEQLLPADKRHKPMEMENGHVEVQGEIKKNTYE